MYVQYLLCAVRKHSNVWLSLLLGKFASGLCSFMNLDMDSMVGILDVELLLGALNVFFRFRINTG